MQVRVWDVPTRLLHWGLAGSAVAAFATGGVPGFGSLHVVAGVAAVAAVIGRGGWGFAGERWSRFDSWSTGPAHSGKAVRSAVTALVGVLVLGSSGMVVQGGEEARGPLAGWVSPAVGVAVHPLHTALAWASVVWLAVHLSGVALQSRKEGQSLVLGIVHGRKQWDGPPVRARLGSALVGGIGVAVVVPLAAAAIDAPHHPPAPQSAAWAEACGECHFAYPPMVLPAASWAEMLAPDADHFGESLGLPAATASALSSFAAVHSADAGETPIAVRMRAEGGAPQRVTATETWRGLHAAVPDAVFGSESVGSRGRCGACHPDAEQGGFDARAVVVPEPEPARPGVPGWRS